MANTDYEVNDKINTIETDSALFDILSNFSDDYIDSIIQGSLQTKFRPYNNKLPNYPFLINSNFQAIFDHYTGESIDTIKQKREDVFMRFVNTICDYYNLSLTNTPDDDRLYPFTYVIYQVFVLEFTERMITFFTNYIIQNAESFVNSLPENRRTAHSNYAKQIFNDKTKTNYLIIYENMPYIFDILAGLDIPFNNLVLGLSDENTANFITAYVADNGDCYKYHYASYLVNSDTKAEMNSAIQLNLMKMVLGTDSILNPNNNPFIKDE